MSLFPALHIRPPAGWINDPNGVCLIDGVYHVFFQYNPHGPVHGQIHWGHAFSSDLLHWEYGPIALAPRPGEADEGGCWSGCLTIDDAGLPAAVYTGIRGSSHEAVVVLARSHDGLQTFTPSPTPAAGMPSDPGISDVRDPFLFSHNGRRLAVQGAGHNPGGPARVLLYDAQDLDNWTLLGDFLTDADPVAAEVAAADIWECPNLLRVGRRWVLLLSVWRWVDGTDDLVGVRYLVGDIENEGDHLRFEPSHGGTLDVGPVFYAPQAFSANGRHLLWGWARELGRSDADLLQAGWAGSLTFPRELSLDARENLVSAPATELAGLRAEALDASDALRHTAFELEGRDMELRLGTEKVVSLAGPGRILVDASMVEAFSEAGEVFTTRAYPDTASAWSVLGDVRAAWRLTR